MNAELLVDGPCYWRRLAADLAGAREQILVQTLCFEADTAGLPLAEALRASPARDRRMVIDEFARHRVNDQFLRDLRHRFDRTLWQEVRDSEAMVAGLERAGVGVRFTNPVGRFYQRMPVRNHKKLVAIDGRIVYVGGINFTAHNFAWHDCMLRLDEPALTAFLIDDFEHTWRGENLAVTRVFDGLEFRILDGRSNEQAFAAVLALIASAKRNVFIQSPYIAPPFSTALGAASRAGIQVTVVTPERNNWSLCHDHIHWTAQNSSLDLRLFPDRMTHMKAILVDERTLVLGSANFDLWSYRFQQEYLCLITDPGVVAAFRERVVVPDLAASRLSDRRVGALRGRWSDLELELLERAAMLANGRRAP